MYLTRLKVTRKEREMSSTLNGLHLFRRTDDEPKRNHENGDTSSGDGDTNGAELPHRRDPILKNDDYICVRTIAKSARVAIAVGKEIGELETRQYDQPQRVGNGEWIADPADGDGEESGDVFDMAGFALAGFRDASEDRRDDGEEHDNNGKPSVDGVSQGAAPQTDGRGEDNDDQGCTGYSTLEEKGENHRFEHRREYSRRKSGTFRGRRSGNLGERPLFLVRDNKFVQGSEDVIDEDEIPHDSGVVERCRMSEFVPMEQTALLLGDEEPIMPMFE